MVLLGYFATFVSQWTNYAHSNNHWINIIGMKNKIEFYAIGSYTLLIKYMKHRRYMVFGFAYIYNNWHSHSFGT